MHTFDSRSLPDKDACVALPPMQRLREAELHFNRTGRDMAGMGGRVVTAGEQPLLEWTS